VTESSFLPEHVQKHCHLVVLRRHQMYPIFRLSATSVDTRRSKDKVFPEIREKAVKFFRVEA
jgi:hypothetical protein